MKLINGSEGAKLQVVTSLTKSNMQGIHYKANITAGGGLIVPESRKIARLLLTYPDKAAWKLAIQEENILQQRSMASAIRIANLIKARIELMTPPLWELIVEGNAKV